MFYGLDGHKEFIQVCAVDANGAKHREYRIWATAEAIEAWGRRLGKRNQVVLEATFHTSAIRAIVSRFAGRVAVAHPLEAKAIAYAKIKTDKVDAHTLTRLLQVNFLPQVPVWTRRRGPFVSSSLTGVSSSSSGWRSRTRSVRRSTADSYPQPEGEPFSGKARRWMRSLDLSATERFLLHDSLDLLEDLARRIAAVDDQH